MPSKREEVEKEIKKIHRQIDQLRAQIKILKNLRQITLKRNKIKALERRIKKLIDSLPGLKQTRRRTYIIDPD